MLFFFFCCLALMGSKGMHLSLSGTICLKRCLALMGSTGLPLLLPGTICLKRF